MSFFEWLNRVVAVLYDEPTIAGGQICILLGFNDDNTADRIWRLACRGEPLDLATAHFHIEFTNDCTLNIATILERIECVYLPNTHTYFSHIHGFSNHRGVATFSVVITLKHDIKDESLTHSLYIGEESEVGYESHLLCVMHGQNAASAILKKNIQYALYALRIAGISRDVRRIITDYCLAPPMIYQWSIQFISSAIGGGASKRLKQK